MSFSPCEGGVHDEVDRSNNPAALIDGDVARSASPAPSAGSSSSSSSPAASYEEERAALMASITSDLKRAAQRVGDIARDLDHSLTVTDEFEAIVGTWNAFAKKAAR